MSDSTAHAAKILAHSISLDGVEIVTMEVVIPRIVLAEFNTHRMFSRNSASSRAIPVKKMIRRVFDDPYVPLEWGKNQKGMQAAFDVDAETAVGSVGVWLAARDFAVCQARRLLELGIHKQLTNRLLEPFMWHTVIVTATEWSNFFHLRNNEMAHPDIHRCAALMQDALDASTPMHLDYGQWHLPLVHDDSELLGGLPMSALEPHYLEWMDFVKISAGRCARVSYLTHDGKRDPKADIELHDKLLGSGHMSPFEHQARPMHPDDVKKLDGIALVRNTVEKGLQLPDGITTDVRDWKRWSGNFRGWVQYRKTIAGEADILGSA